MAAINPLTAPIGERRGVSVDRGTKQTGKFSGLPEGVESRDFVARKAGFRNGRTYEQAREVVAAAGKGGRFAKAFDDMNRTGRVNLRPVMACLFVRVLEKLPVPLSGRERPVDDSIVEQPREDGMTTIKASARLAILCASLVIAGTCWAADNTYPNHKVRMIVPMAAGGPTDVIGRMVAERLSDVFGQQVYVENLPGAGGNLGTETAKRAAPDGYTILTVSTNFIINPSMFTKIGYDPIKDFAPISLVAASPNVVTVNPSVPAKTLKELIDVIKANPGKYSYAQPATGSTPHLAGELFKQTYGLDLVMVPFTGAALAINSTMGGHTPIAFTALPPAIGNIQNGSLRGIAILAKQRVVSLPDLPTNIEEGVPGLESDTLTGIVAPAGTPQAIIDKCNAAIVKMVADPEIKKKLAALGFVPVGDTPAEFGERIQSEMARWDKVVKAAGIHVD